MVFHDTPSPRAREKVIVYEFTEKKIFQVITAVSYTQFYLLILLFSVHSTYINGSMSFISFKYANYETK